MIIIEAKNLILGRIATHVAKKALLGESVNIVNCENAIISGKKSRVLSEYKRKRSRGEPSHGPHFPRRADLIVKRTIRGMLPYKTARGENALKNIKCYLGVPKEFESTKAHTIKEANFEKLQNLQYISVGELSKLLGSKI